MLCGKKRRGEESKTRNTDDSRTKGADPGTDLLTVGFEMDFVLTSFYMMLRADERNPYALRLAQLHMRGCRM